jgi:hypothetical protein
MIKATIGIVALAAGMALMAPVARAQDMDACGKPMTPERILQATKDYQDVLNTADKHEYYHNDWAHADEIRNIWAQHHDDTVTWTNNTDKYIGMKDLWRFYVENLKTQNLVGSLAYHMLTTPVIVIAGDGQTAKGIFMSFGNVAGSMGGSTMADWTEEKYGIDFVKEDGKWKIWHLRTYVEYYFPIHGDFTVPDDNMAAPDRLKKNPIPPGAPPQAAETKGSNSGATIKSEPGSNFDMAKPTEKGDYYDGYYTTRPLSFNPPIPKDYCHWDDSMSF